MMATVWILSILKACDNRLLFSFDVSGIRPTMCATEPVTDRVPGILDLCVDILSVLRCFVFFACRWRKYVKKLQPLNQIISTVCLRRILQDFVVLRLCGFLAIGPFERT